VNLSSRRCSFPVLKRQIQQNTIEKEFSVDQEKIADVQKNKEHEDEIDGADSPRGEAVDKEHTDPAGQLTGLADDLTAMREYLIIEGNALKVLGKGGRLLDLALHPRCHRLTHLYGLGGYNANQSRNRH
jgi:hypothetical protein